jgi:hypothetical protein
MDVTFAFSIRLMVARVIPDRRASSAWLIPIATLTSRTRNVIGDMY